MEKINGKEFARWVDSEFDRLGLKKEKMFNETSITSANLSHWRSGTFNPSKKKAEEVKAFIKKETKKDLAQKGEADGEYDAELNCITHQAPISVLAAMYQMNSVVLSKAIGVDNDRASFLLTAFGVPIDDECKKAAEFFELKYDDLRSGRVPVRFNPAVQGKIYQLSLEASRQA